MIRQPGEGFSQQVYAAKFHFHSGSPGYIGDLYIIQGDVLTGDPPMMLIRDRDKKLRLLESESGESKVTILS